MRADVPRESGMAVERRTSKGVPTHLVVRCLYKFSKSELLQVCGTETSNHVY